MQRLLDNLNDLMEENRLFNRAAKPFGRLNGRFGIKVSTAISLRTPTAETGNHDSAFNASQAIET